MPDEIERLHLAAAEVERLVTPPSLDSLRSVAHRRKARTRSASVAGVAAIAAVAAVVWAQVGGNPRLTPPLPGTPSATGGTTAPTDSVDAAKAIIARATRVTTIAGMPDGHLLAVFSPCSSGEACQGAWQLYDSAGAPVAGGVLALGDVVVQASPSGFVLTYPRDAPGSPVDLISGDGAVTQARQVADSAAVRVGDVVVAGKGAPSVVRPSEGAVFALTGLPPKASDAVAGGSVDGEGRLWLATTDAAGGLTWWWRDGSGDQWSSTTIPPGNGAYSPATVTRHGPQILALVSREGEPASSTEGRLSTDGGRTWSVWEPGVMPYEAIPAVLPDGSLLVVGSTDPTTEGALVGDQALWRAPAGDWSTLVLVQSWPAPSDGTHLLAVSGSRLYLGRGGLDVQVSTDGGRTWAKAVL